MKKQTALTKNLLIGWRYIINAVFIVIVAGGAYAQPGSYKSASLELIPLKPGVYQHISYLVTDTWGKVPCNGMLMVSKDSVIIFDTPASDSATRELIQVLTKTWKLGIKAVVVNHFHNDCLAGLKALHEAGAVSYGSYKTIELAKAAGDTAPRIGFDKKLILSLENRVAINQYFGEGHTKDNIVSYLPGEQVLFGGCLIKEINAGKGFLGDANVGAWPATVRAVRQAFPRLAVVIPGHGAVGDQRLLSYTIKLFSN